MSYFLTLATISLSLHDTQVLGVISLSLHVLACTPTQNDSKKEAAGPGSKAGAKVPKTPKSAVQVITESEEGEGDGDEDNGDAEEAEDIEDELKALEKLEEETSVDAKKRKGGAQTKSAKKPKQA